MNFPAKPTFVIKTLGCKVNQYETELMRESLEKNGFLEETGKNAADFYIINSCTVTNKADKDTRNLIRHFHRLNPEAKIIVAGCYAELERDRKVLAEMAGVTHLIRNNEKPYIAEILSRQSKNRSAESGISAFKSRNRAFIKIQDGCSHKCSYCKVCIVRGPSRSRRAGEIIEEAKRLVEKGFKEIVLTGVCLGAWGRDLEAKMDLSWLVSEICRISGFFRVRLSSIEPVYATSKLVNAIRDNQKVCKHLHIPLQSGDDRILRLMRRPYTAQKFRQIIKNARKLIPDIAITTDVLVGFPGENKAAFWNTVEFLKEIKPSRMHVFSYSKREGTPAAEFKFDTEDKARIRKRVRLLGELGRNFSMDFAAGFMGKKQYALIESRRDKITNLLCGYTDRYVRLLVDGSDSVKNKLVPVRVVDIDRKKGAVFACLSEDACAPPVNHRYYPRFID